MSATPEHPSQFHLRKIYRQPINFTMSIRVLPSTAVFLTLAALMAYGERAGDGFTMKEVPGLALVKPQAWSKDSEASILEFTGYIDRSAVGHGGAGYFEFRLRSGQRRQVDVARVVKVVEYPDPSRVENVLDARDREKIEATLRELEAIIAKFPATRTYLQQPMRDFATLLESYDAGKVKYQGAWMPRSVYAESQARRYAALIKEDIEAARPPGSHDLRMDPKFLELDVLAKDSPVAARLAKELRERNEALAQGERRRQILEKLGDAGLPLAACRKLLEELAGLQPLEEDGSLKALERWQSAIQQAEALDAAARPLAEAIETKLANASDPASPPTLDSETAVAASALAGKIESWQASGPPPPTREILEKAEAVAATAQLVSRLPTYLQSRQLLELQNILDTQGLVAAATGPATREFLQRLRKWAGERVEAFVAAREQGRQFAQNGQLAEARAKYEEALAIIADESLAKALQQLGAPAGP